MSKSRYGMSLDDAIVARVDALRGRYPRTSLVEDLLEEWADKQAPVSKPPAAHRDGRQASTRRVADAAIKPLPKIAPRRQP